MAGIQLRSPSFVDHQPIPARHAKDHHTLCPAPERPPMTRACLGGRQLTSGTLVGTYQR